VREDLVDHGQWRDPGDEAQHAVAASACEGVDLDELLQHRRRKAFAHRRVAFVGASRSAGTIAGGVSASAGSA